MPVETDYQKHILDVIIAEGGYGIKLSNRFLVGIPDLFIKPLHAVASLVEVKLQKGYPVNPDTPIHVNITALQRHHLMQYSKAGGISGWIMIVSGATGIVHMLGSPRIDWRPTKREFMQCAVTKTPQTGWEMPVWVVLRQIYNDS